MVQDSWWDDMLLHISRMTEKRNDTLTVRALLARVKPAIKDEVRSRLDSVAEAAESVKDLRDRHIAHRSIDVVLRKPNAEPLPELSRDQVLKAIGEIDSTLHFVEHFFFKTEPPNYDHLDIRGGWWNVLDIVERGLRSRDDESRL
jgi:hypothetical protein